MRACILALATLASSIAGCRGSDEHAGRLPVEPVEASTPVTSAAPAKSSGATTAVPPVATPGVLADSYRGTIGDLPVVLRLRRNGRALAGSYFYEKSGIDLDLAGDLEASGDLALSESSGGAKTGELRGHVGPDGTITGSWTNPSGSRTLPLRVAPIPRPASPETALVFQKKLLYSEPVVGNDGGRMPGACKGDTTYPEVFGLADPAIEQKLNAKLAPNEDEQPPRPCDHATEAGGGYTVGYDAHGILSVRLAWSIADSEAAHPSSGATAVNVFLRDGSAVSLFGDVLKPGSEKAFEAALGPQIDAAAGGDPDGRSALADALTPPFDDFLIEPKGIRVFVLSRLGHAYQGLDAEGFQLPYKALQNAHGRAAAVWPP